jgi:hypothetical protein
MKNLAIIALCLLSSFASANEIEEVVVKARQIKIVLNWKLGEMHKQNPITKNWHYTEPKKEKVQDKKA